MIRQDGLKHGSMVYGMFPYTRRLLYQVQEKRVASLCDVQAATRYLGAHDSGSSMTAPRGFLEEELSSSPLMSCI